MRVTTAAADTAAHCKHAAWLLSDPVQTITCYRECPVVYFPFAAAADSIDSVLLLPGAMTGAEQACHPCHMHARCVSCGCQLTGALATAHKAGYHRAARIKAGTDLRA
jgi:hypothetical protein